MNRFVAFYTVVIVLLIGAFWLMGQVFLTSSNEATARFVVEPEQGVISIADDLLANGFIRSKTIFILYSFLSGNFSKYQPGAYFISPALTLGDITTLLSSGPNEAQITIPPGATLKEIDDRLAQGGVIESGALASLSPLQFVSQYPFLEGRESLEGFLMPDTYRLYLHYDASLAARVMLDNFKNKIQPLLDAGSKDEYKTLIIASLIEKEVHDPLDQQLVSSVIYNRLSAGMPLQIDAAVLYGACRGVFSGCNIDKSFFREDTPYNTYTRSGIVPTPISNPSPEAVKAALSPPKTDYFFYLSDRDTGKTYFSVTLDEHNEKRARYLGL